MEESVGDDQSHAADDGEHEPLDLRRVEGPDRAEEQDDAGEVEEGTVPTPVGPEQTGVQLGRGNGGHDRDQGEPSCGVDSRAGGNRHLPGRNQADRAEDHDGGGGHHDQRGLRQLEHVGTVSPESGRDDGHDEKQHALPGQVETIGEVAVHAPRAYAWRQRLGRGDVGPNDRSRISRPLLHYSRLLAFDI